MVNRVPFLRHIQHTADETGENYLLLEDCWNLLKQKRSPADKELRKDNFIRHCKPNLKTIDEKVYVHLSSFIHFVYSQRSNHSTCSKICSQIESNILSRTTVKNVLELYKLVAEFNFNRVEKIESFLFESAKFEESPTLIADHKHYFNEKQWNRICLFERHFSLIPGVLDLSYDEQLARRIELFENLETSKNISKHIADVSKATIARRDARHKLAVQAELLFWFDNKKHIPCKIEQDISTEILAVFELFEPTGVVVANCTRSCPETCHGAHVYIELPASDQQYDFASVGAICAATLAKKHSLDCTNVLFFQSGTFSDFREDGGSIARLRLQDAIRSHKLVESLQITWSPTFDSGATEVEESECHSCFSSDGYIKPLNWCNFNVIEEWVEDMPLEIQILLENFISHKSILRTEELGRLLKGKIVRLYSMFDSLLNLLNKNHIGVIQELNTAELMINYHNISSTFKVTQAMGITAGQHFAEKDWRKRSTETAAYYNYAVRKVPLTYTTAAGEGCYLISLRDCYKIAMRDNLVTLTERANPDPGESRTGQICTIQGTDIGIPKDSVALLAFHKDSCTDPTANCPCMFASTLEKDDLPNVLLNLTPEEQDAKQNFLKLCVWGLSAVWKKLHEDDTLASLMAMADEDNHTMEGSTDIDALDKSFGELSFCDVQSTVEIESLDHEAHAADDDLQNIQMALNNIEQNISIPEEVTDVCVRQDYLDSDLDVTLDEAEGLQGDDEVDTTSDEDEDDTAEKMGFKRFIPPPFIVRHTPSWIGRDDDVRKIEEVLDCLLTMTDMQGDFGILAVDQKLVHVI